LKFIYVGDPHERVSQPKNRTDNFKETYKNKVEEIKRLVEKHEAKAILQPGDFLDAPKYDNAFLMEVIERWSIVPTHQLISDLYTGKLSSKDVVKAMSKNTPIVGAIGNHELFGDAIQSFPKTSLAFLEKMGFMILPSKEKPFILTSDDGTTVAITSAHYHSKMDTDEHVEDYIVEKKAADYHIHMVHGYLTNRDMGELFNHTTLDKIAHETKADLTLAGHDHIGFPLTEVDGKLFINPGSMTRTKNDIKEMKRQPKALVISVSKEEGLTVEEVPLESAKEGKEVLSRELIKKRDEKTAQMEEIKTIVNQAQVEQGTSIQSIIKNIGEAKHIEKEIIDEVTVLVSDKINEMNPEKDEMSDPYTIKKLTLENFQGHGHTVMTLSEGLNVIVGESSHGKSSIYRALNWLYDNGGTNPRQYIKKGTTYAKVTIELSNGVRITRLVESKKSGKNGYSVYDPVTGEVKDMNTRGVEEVRKLLGFNKVPLDSGKELDINFMGQGESWFFIGKHVTSSERAKIIGTIFGTHYTDAVIKDLEGTMKKSDATLKQLEKEKEDISNEIKNYDFLSDLTKKLSNVEDALTKTKELEQKIKKIQEFHHKNNTLRKQIDQLKVVYAKLGSIDDARKQCDQLKVKQMTMQLIVKQHVSLKNIKQSSDQNKKIIQSLKDISTSRQLLSGIKEKTNKVNDLKRQHKDYQQLAERLTKINNTENIVRHVLSKTEVMDDVREKFNFVKRTTEDIGKKKELLKKHSTLSTQVGKGKDFLLTNKNDMERLLNDYEDALVHVGTCPTCHNKIDKAVVNQVVKTYKEKIK